MSKRASKNDPTQRVLPPVTKPSVEVPEKHEDSQAKSFEERREFPRFPFRGRAKAIVFPAPESPKGTHFQDSEVITSDLSRGGVSILYQTKLQVGQQLLLMLNDKTQLVEVRWCCRVWDGLFAAGCRFLAEAREVDVDQQLVAIDVVISSEQSWWNEDQSA
jgi:PilZ domain